jgi:formylglycine-generating enzyme required for sulfatase activity
MIAIPGGVIVKGRPPRSAPPYVSGEISKYAPEGYTFRQYVAPFDIDKVEVTNGAYLACERAGACHPPKGTGAQRSLCADRSESARANHPVTCVDRTEATAFCRWQEKRLPTDAEWAFAARGDDGRWFPWKEGAPADICWMRGDPNGGPQIVDGRVTVNTCPVGTSAQDRSPFGVLDMAGSVREWTDSDFAPGYDDPAEGTSVDAVWAASGVVVRGGAWNSVSADAMSLLDPRGIPASTQGPDIGFRCARSREAGHEGAPARPPMDPFPEIAEGAMVRVPGGTFAPPVTSTGGDAGSATSGGSPVEVRPFQIDVTEVTAEAYVACVEAKRCMSTVIEPVRPPVGPPTGCNQAEKARQAHPINCVTLEQAAAYCRWKKKRLPTSAEWAYAAYGFEGQGDAGHHPSAYADVCWGRDGIPLDQPYRGTCPAARHRGDRNGLGLFDTRGNVSELTVPAAADLDAGLTRSSGAREKVLAVVQGHDWSELPTAPESVRHVERNVIEGHERPDPRIGFRCAR